MCLYQFIVKSEINFKIEILYGKRNELSINVAVF